MSGSLSCNSLQAFAAEVALQTSAVGDVGVGAVGDVAAAGAVAADAADAAGAASAAATTAAGPRSADVENAAVDVEDTAESDDDNTSVDVLAPDLCDPRNWPLARVR